MSSKRRMPDERKSVTHKLVLNDEVDVYITVGMFEDGTPGEIFIKVGKMVDLGRAISMWAIAVSMLLQSGTSLSDIVDKFSFRKFKPDGWTNSEEIRHADSIVDYTVRWMNNTWGDNEKKHCHNSCQ